MRTLPQEYFNENVFTVEHEFKHDDFLGALYGFPVTNEGSKV